LIKVLPVFTFGNNGTELLPEGLKRARRNISFVEDLLANDLKEAEGQAKQS